MKRLFLQIAAFLAIGTSASAADSTMVRFDFASAADQSGTYETTLHQGAQIIEYAGRNVLSLGNDNGYLDFGTKMGELIGSLGTFTITMNVYIPETTNITGNGNFIWCFATSSSTPRSHATPSPRQTTRASRDSAWQHHSRKDDG